MARHPSHILEPARRGAAIQLCDLVQEIKYLTDVFPQLREPLVTPRAPVRL